MIGEHKRIHRVRQPIVHEIGWNVSQRRQILTFAGQVVREEVHDVTDTAEHL